MKLPRFGPSARRTKSSIQDRELRASRGMLLARPRLHVSVRVELEGLLAGGIRKWNGVWGHDPLIVVAGDALRKPQVSSAQLDVRHGIACQHGCRRLRAAGP